ncbi:hypothetical protein GQ607_014222 [Colletotrichum asianum]|uniref:Uncharacterized protein n=1 Tax=Colletotrichum asianum TaxID=702518 RepID=A0A8H3W318_9PEZI|nr:hypothetical protein GQ607_014222 [Colletotrichum asianum]
MPTIVNGYLAPDRRYTARERLTRALHPLLHPSILTLRDVAWAAYIIYIGRVTYFTLRSIAYLIFEAEGRRRWTEPRPEWGPPPEGWTMGWGLMGRLLRGLVWRRVMDKAEAVAEADRPHPASARPLIPRFQFLGHNSIGILLYDSPILALLVFMMRCHF